MNQKTLKILGWIATGTAMLMYISYFPQIINNLHGNKSGFLQPMVAAINCTLWVSYGFFQEKKDWPIVVANLPGIIFGTLAAITALQNYFVNVIYGMTLMMKSKESEMGFYYFFFFILFYERYYNKTINH